MINLTLEQAPKLSPDGTYHITVMLVSGNTILQSFNLIVSALLMTLDNKQIKYRSNALKAVTGLVEVDPTILGYPPIQKAVNARFKDTSVSVRESAIDLIGRFIQHKYNFFIYSYIRPEFTKNYLGVVMESLKDTGKSVRKRVIRIMKTLVAANPTSDHTKIICCKLSSRLDDGEDSIRTLVRTFYKGMY